MKIIRAYLPAAACLLALSAGGFIACAPGEERVDDEPIEETVIIEEPVAAPRQATVVLRPADDVDLYGEATFTEEDGTVTLRAEVHGAPAGTHGFHVHQTGVCDEPDFSSAGGHFNPAGVDHGCPPTAPRHAGDFGNIEIGEDGSGSLEVSVPAELVSVSAGEHSLVGLAVILHGGTDDCSSQPTGAAGPRLACGVIEAGGTVEPAMDESMEEGMDGEEGEPANGAAH